MPYVVETSVGLDRLFLSILATAFTEEKLEDGSERTVLRIPPFLAPVKACIMPLVKKDGLPEIAQKLFDELKFDFLLQYDEKDAIGKRYRRQDAIGTPFCITIDHDTLNDNAVTIRHRDTMLQERIPLNKVAEIINEKVNFNKILRTI